MLKDELKKELVALIENTNDEGLLSLLKEDFIFYGNLKNTDITDELNNEQLKELRALSEEDETKDTHTWDDYKNATKRWRIK